MSKYNPKRTFPPDKNVFVSQTIPDTLIDNIRTIVNAGEFGKLEELLINYPVNLNFKESKLNTSLLHSVIRSTITNTQKLRLVELLIKRGIPINITDDNGFTPLYYAIQLQLPDLVRILIERSSNLSTLPQNYDYFRLALSPSIVNCKPQLLNESVAYMGKYYSQQLDFEREFRQAMNSQPITKQMVKYILEFCKKLPEQELKYIDMETKSIEGTPNVKLLGSPFNEILPLFENKIKSFLDTVPDKIKGFLDTGKINDDQLITTKIELIRSMVTELKDFLNIKSIKETVGVNKTYNYRDAEQPDYIYDNFIELKDFNYKTILGNFLNKYNGEVDNLKEFIIDFRDNIINIIKELMVLESTLMSSYPIFSAGNADELPKLSIGSPPQLNIINDKLSQRLFYDSGRDINPVDIQRQVNDFKGGYLNNTNSGNNLQQGGTPDKLTIIINTFAAEINKVPQLSNQALLNEINTDLGYIFLSTPILGLALNINLLNPAFAQTAFNRVRLNNIMQFLNNFRVNLDSAITNGVKMNNLLNESIINYNLLNNTVIPDYNLDINALQNSLCRIYNEIHYSNFGILGQNFSAFSGYFNNLLKYLVDIYNNVSTSAITLNIGAGSANVAQPPNIPGSNINNVMINAVNLPVINSNIALGIINIAQIIPVSNHLYYDKIEPILDSIQTELGKFDSPPENIIESINIFRKVIYLSNYAISTISYSINKSKFFNDDYDKNLNRFKQLINSILTEPIKTKQLVDLERFNTKKYELGGYLGKALNELSDNTKKFNIFITEINNISEQLLLYNKFNSIIPVPEKKFLFNDIFVMYTPINNPYESIKKLYYHNNSLSLYSQQQNLVYYNDLPESLQYRIPVPNSDIIVKSSDNYKKLVNDQRKNMMGLYGKSFALTLPIMDNILIRNMVTSLLNGIIVIPNYTVNEKIKSATDDIIDAHDTIKDEVIFNINIIRGGAAILPINLLPGKLQFLKDIKVLNPNQINIDEIQNIIRRVVDILVMKIGTFLGENFYGNGPNQINTNITNYLIPQDPIINAKEPIILAIQTTLSKIISGIDFESALDAGVNAGFSYVKSRLIGPPNEIIPIIPESILNTIQNEIYPGGIPAPPNPYPILAVNPSVIIAGNPILFRLRNLIENSITASITEVNRQLPPAQQIQAINVLPYTDIGLISILMVIAIENIKIYSGTIDNFDDNYDEFNRLRLNIIPLVPIIPNQIYSMLTIVMGVYADSTISHSLAAGVAATLVFSRVNPAVNINIIKALISGVTVVNSILNNLSNSEIILTTTIALEMSQQILNIFNTQYVSDDRNNNRTQELLKKLVPATIPIIDNNGNQISDLDNIPGLGVAPIPAGVVIPNILDINIAIKLLVTLQNELLPVFYTAKQQCDTNINTEHLKIASAASIRGFAYFKVPNAVDNMRPLLTRNITEPNLQGLPISTVSENIHSIIDDTNISVEKINVSGLAAIASMGVIPRYMGANRVWELFNGPLGVFRNAPPAGPPIPPVYYESAFNNSKIAFELGFSSEVSVITGVAVAINTVFDPTNTPNIINACIIHAGILVNLSPVEATTLGSVIQNIFIPPVALTIIQIANLSTLCLCLLRNGLSENSVIEGLKPRIIVAGAQLKRHVAAAIYTEILWQNNQVAAAAAAPVVLQPVNDQFIDLISRNLGDINYLLQDKLSISDFPNIYSNKLITSRDYNWKDSLYTLTYLPNMKVTNMNFLLLIYHEYIFKLFLGPVPLGPGLNPDDPTYLAYKYNQIKIKFKQLNPSIDDSLLTTLVLRILHSSILNNFEEIINSVLRTIANTLINYKLNKENLIDKFEEVDDTNILNILKEKERKKLRNLTRVDVEQDFYLDENYSSSEPIDIISCVNNNVEILKLLKKRMSIKVREYQELIFKLGNSVILRELNLTTSNKITVIDLETYRNKNKQKYRNSCSFFKEQLNDEIKAKELSFFIDDTVDVIVSLEDDLDLENNQIKLVMNREEPILVVPGVPVANQGNNWTYTLRFQDIYNDLINNQEKSNIYLFEKIKNKLEYIFEMIVIPEITEFLEFYSDNELKSVITYDNLKENLKPLISDIINYHLNIDPTKAKKEVIPLDDTLSKFKELFINLLEQTDKQSIPTIYDDRLKIKVYDFMTIISKYYVNIYRNYLKCAFNDYRCEKLVRVL